MKKIIISIIAVILIIFLSLVIFFIYHLFGDDITKIDNIKENEKRKIISLMKLEDFYDEINLEKIAVPLTKIINIFVLYQIWKNKSTY